MWTYALLTIAVVAAGGVLATPPSGGEYIGQFDAPSVAAAGGHDAENKNYSIELHEKQAHPVLTVRTPAATTSSIYLHERPRFEPTVTLSVSKGLVTGVEVHYGVDAFAVPPNTLVIRSRSKSEHVVFKHHFAPLSTEQSAYVAAHFQLADFDDPIVSAELSVDPQVVTTFEYELPDGFSSEIFDSQQTYDLVPHNATMQSKFMARFTHGAQTTLSLWVSRKAIAPDFTLLVKVGEEVFAQANVQHDGRSGDALGYDIDVTDNVGKLLKLPVTLVVHFYELARSRRAVLLLPNLRQTISDLETNAKNKKSENAASSPVATFQEGAVTARFTFYPELRFLGLHLLFDGSVADVQLSLYSQVSTGPDDATPYRLVMREGDTVVPSYPKSSAAQYGWDDALPVAKPDLEEEQDSVDLFDGPMELVVDYNLVLPAQTTVAEELRRWIEGQGGELNGIDLGFLDKADHSFVRRHPVIASVGLPAGATVASIPYTALVTTSLVEGGHWGTVLREHGGMHESHVEEADMHRDAGQILRLTATVLLHLYDESANFRPYFRTYGASSVKLPAFYSEEELELFGFDPQVAVEAGRMKGLWDIEFEVLKAAEARLPRHATKEDFYRVRSQVETRLLNLSSQLALVPVLDLLTHDDEPSAAVHYDDETHRVIVKTTTPIPAGSPVTVDFGRELKAPLDFLLQHGFVPPGAAEAVAITVEPLGAVYVTSDPGSRNAVAAQVRKAMAAKKEGREYDPESADDDDDDDGGEALSMVVKTIDARSTALNEFQMPPHAGGELLSTATEMLTMERSVLQKLARARD